MLARHFADQGMGLGREARGRFGTVAFGQAPERPAAFQQVLDPVHRLGSELRDGLGDRAFRSDSQALPKIAG